MPLLDLTILAQLEPFLRVGTCSWKYDSWKGLIYEEQRRYKQEEYLADYAKRLNTVEIDQWFWSLFPSGIKLPDARAVKGYASSVPDDFVFTVKAPNAITLTHFYGRQSKRYAECLRCRAGRPWNASTRDRH